MSLPNYDSEEKIVNLIHFDSPYPTHQCCVIGSFLWETSWIRIQKVKKSLKISQKVHVLLLKKEREKKNLIYFIKENTVQTLHVNKT